jgi:hypothetical protein
MRKPSRTLVTTLAGLAALVAGACSSKSPISSDGSGSGGTGGTAGDSGSSFVGIALMPSATGVVDDVRSGVMGAWYADGDSVGPGANAAGSDFSDSDCARAGFTMDQCSTIVAPSPGQPFAPDPDKGMCTRGTAAQVIAGDGGQNDYHDIWGAGIGLDFKNPGGDAGATKGYFDMTPYVGIGFDFTGDVIPTGSMRVNFPFNGEDADNPPYWHPDQTAASSPLANGAHVEVKWADVSSPMYLTQGVPPPPPFDKTQVASIQFLVFTSSSATTPFSYCVDNLTLLTAL